MAAKSKASKSLKVTIEWIYEELLCQTTQRVRELRNLYYEMDALLGRPDTASALPGGVHSWQNMADYEKVNDSIIR